MAKIARSIDDFSRSEGINPPANPIGEISTKYYVPSNFLTFYQNIIGLINQYQLAFEEENFNRMAQYIISINSAIIKYFNSNSSELKTELNGIVKDTTDEVDKAIAERKSKSCSKEEVQEAIEAIVESYKTKILNKIKSLTVAKSVSTTNESRSPKTKQEKLAIINAANELLKAKEKEYDKAVGIFSVSLGRTILNNFKDILSKINNKNLKDMQNNIRALNTAYDTQFYAILSNLNVYDNQKDSLLKILGKGMKAMSTGIINVGTYTLSRTLKIAFGIKAFANVIGFWGKKIFGGVASIIKFGVKIVTGALKLAFGAIKFAVKLVYSLVKPIANSITKCFSTISKQANGIFSYVFKFSFADFLKNTFSAFFKSYAGAYFLGYMTGMVWKKILVLLGIDKVVSPSEGVVDGVLMPFFNALKKRFDDRAAAIKEIYAINSQDIVSAVTGSYLWTNLMDLIRVADNYINGNLRTDVEALITTANELYTNYLGPLAHTLWSLISIFVEGYIAEPKIAKRTYIGTLVALKQAAFFAKRAKAAGGIAMIAAALVGLGAGAILSQGKGEAEKNENEKAYPLNIAISKKYAHLYGYPESEEEKAKREKRSYRTISQQSKDALGDVFAMIDKINDEKDRGEYSKKYKELESIYLSLLYERTDLYNYSEQLADLFTFINEQKDARSSVNLFETTLGQSILFKNNIPIIDLKYLRKMTSLSSQIPFLQHIVDARSEKNEEIISEINKILKTAKTPADFSAAYDKIKEQRLNNSYGLNLVGLDYDKNYEFSSGTQQTILMKPITQQVFSGPVKTMNDRMSIAYSRSPFVSEFNNLDLSVFSADSSTNQALNADFIKREQEIIDQETQLTNRLVNTVLYNRNIDQQNDYLDFLQKNFPNDSIKVKTSTQRGVQKTEEIKFKDIDTTSKKGNRNIELNEYRKLMLGTISKSKYSSAYYEYLSQKNGSIIYNDAQKIRQSRRQLETYRQSKITKALSKENLLMLFTVLGKVVNIFKINYIEAFKQHGLFSKIKNSIGFISELEEGLNIRLKWNLNLISLSQLEKNFKENYTPDVEGIVAYAGDIFNHALRDLNGAIASFSSLEPDEIEIARNIYVDLQNKKFVDSQQEPIEEFLKTQTESQKIIDTLKKLLNIK